jgi:beta-lactam-binding protein with PASTA domain
MLRLFMVLALSLAAVILPAPVLAVMPFEEEQVTSEVVDARADRLTPPVFLAQALDQERRGPRALGAVSDAVEVPSLQCLSTADAETTLRERGLRLGQVHQRASSACPDGGVVAQSPPRGRTVRPGTSVEVVVTANQNAPRTRTVSGVPEVVGLTPAEAQSLLRREGLDIGQIERKSAAARLGVIIEQAPPGGSPPPVGGRINIAVAAEVRIPDLRTLTREDAVSKLQESSLALGRVTEESSSQPNGTIIKQWPLPGVPAAADDKVDITVAKGQTVPNLRSLTLNDARERLRSAGLSPGRVDSLVSDQPRGTIIDQQPAANAVVSPGVTVNVTLAATPIVPDLTGRTVDEARRLITAQLLTVGSVTTKVSSGPQGTIIEQQPRPDAEASPGTPVNLVLAEGIEVPNLVGLTLEDAGAELAKQLMRLGKVDRRTTPDGDGRIIEQSPTAGSPAGFGAGINVTVTEAPVVPDLLGLSPDAVASTLADKQLVLSQIDYQLAFDRTDQTVLSQDPPPGTPIVNGGTVSVVLAVTAPPPGQPDLVPVPEVTNLTAAQASQSLNDSGLLLQLDGTEDGTRPGRITAQSPTSGRFLKIGSSVLARLEPIDRVLVPDFTGVAETTINSRLSDAFLELGDQDWRLSTQPDGTVIDQDPAPGTTVALGNTVNVVFSASALIPDLTGLTPEEANPVLISQSLRLGGVEQAFSLRWPGTIVNQTPEPNSPARLDTVVKVHVVGLTGPLTAAGSLLLALAAIVWFRARQGGGFATAGYAGSTPKPPPVYGIAKSGTAAPAVGRKKRTSKPATPARPHIDYVVHADPGTQVTQTDASSLVRSSIRVRGRTDPGEQSLAIDSF